MSYAERHRRIAANFAALVDSVPGHDWDNPTPVSEWAARDIVSHLIEWPRGFLGAGAGIDLDEIPSLVDDPAAAWHAHCAQIQALVDDPGDRLVANPHIGDVPLAEAIDRFYTADVLMHTWDLARAIGQDHGLDPEECAALLAGMEPADEMLRQSGQYGPRVHVADDADPVDALMAFIGRDPAWSPV